MFLNCLFLNIYFLLFVIIRFIVCYDIISMVLFNIIILIVVFRMTFLIPKKPFSAWVNQHKIFVIKMNYPASILQNQTSK